MKNLTFFFFLLYFSVTAQTDEYRIMTDDLEIIHSNKIRYSDSGKFLYVEDSTGEVFKLDVENVVSKRKVIDNWNYFDWSDNGLNDFTIVEMDSLSQKELFDMTMNWIKETYENPDEVIKTTIENSKIRFEGHSAFLKIKPLGGGKIMKYSGNYSVAISFKDGKYKFDPLRVTADIPYKGTVLPLNDSSWLYKKSGNIKSYCKYYPASIEDLFNELNQSLFFYIITKKYEISSDDNW